MNANRLLSLYPQAWRDRYGDEFAALLEQSPHSPMVVFDVVRGALDAHVHWNTVRDGSMRNRTTILTIFCAYIAFVVGGLSLLETIDDSPFVPAMKTHSALAAAWEVLAAGSAVALLAVVIGGLPVALAVLRYGLASARRNLFLLAVPALALLVLAAYLGLVVAINPETASRTTRAALAVTWVVLFLTAAVASTAAACLAVLRSEIGEQQVRVKGLRLAIQPERFVTIPTVVTVAAMAVMFGAALCWVVLARSDVPQAYHGHYGLFGVDTPLTLLGSLAVMAVATAIAALAAARGFASRQLFFG